MPGQENKNSDAYLLNPLRGGKREGSGRPVGPEKNRYVAMVLPETSDFLERLAFVLGEPNGVVLDRVVEGFRKDQNFFKNLFDVSPSVVRLSPQSKAVKPETDNKN